MPSDRPPTCALADIVRQRTGLVAVEQRRLDGGMVADVCRLTLEDGRMIVAKSAKGERAHLDVEARMVRHLHEAYPGITPEVIYADRELLLETLMPGSHMTDVAGASLGQHLAQLHRNHAEAFGFDGPTLNGWFLLPNEPTQAWIPFFADQRLRHAADAAVANGTLNRSFRRRIETLCERLPQLLTEPEAPTLLHCDLWPGNILADGATVTGLIDPSVVYGHPELELAHLVDRPYADAVFAAYQRVHPIEPEFFTVRAPVYLTYTATVHVLYFGHRYEGWLDRTLTDSGV